MKRASDAKALLIGGEWRADSDDVIVSVNPATGQVNYEVCAATARHVDAAVEAATQAAHASAWRNMLPHKRARLLAKLADIIEARGEDLARTQMVENGRSWRNAGRRRLRLQRRSATTRRCAKRWGRK
jgi:betaine-aldehyde dehydrogenase